MTSAVLPALASPAAMLMAVVVLPTPALLIATLMILATSCGPPDVRSMGSRRGGS
jgi:hypothetical protein